MEDTKMDMCEQTPTFHWYKHCNLYKNVDVIILCIFWYVDGYKLKNGLLV